ncbi:hypothetical protein GDO86_009273 [Hymenochirus boettgeri]|uniref:Heme-binding protein 1 n=1 Tax=Hymenochirus boettgeri TaxID=247094 RepID=A0A8T2JKI3_9PIPI|nr:hypothetical protein GDO86_009273 [Hymenochirus boettgeri]
MKNPRFLLLLTLFSLYCKVSNTEDVSTDTETYPAFCRSSKCPKYQLVKTYEKFEHRIYDATNWATTYLELDFFGIGMAKSFKRLHDYINGKNSEGLKLKMAVPVRVQVSLKDNSTSNATMSFFLPPAVVTPPSPLNPDVYIESFHNMSVYVKTFGGYALNFHYEKHSKKLEQELLALDLPYNNTYGIAAGYNDPLIVFNRHNEVWFTAL